MEKAVPSAGDSQAVELEVPALSSGAQSSSELSSGSGPTNAPNVPMIEQLIACHAAHVFRFAYRLTGSAADAEDLTQQTFLLAHQRIHQLRDGEKGASWLLTIVRNCFLKSRRKGQVFEPMNEDFIPDDVAAMPDEIDPERIQLALHRLPDESRAIVLLYFFEECSYKEIADSLGIPIGTVMSRLSRAKIRLREALKDEAWAVPAAAEHR